MSKKPKVQKPKPPFQMTPARQRILAALGGGARILVTNDNRDGRKPTSYSLEGPGPDARVSEATLELFVPIMIRERLIQPVDDGLFRGCSQTYIVVR